MNAAVWGSLFRIFHDEDNSITENIPHKAPFKTEGRSKLRQLERLYLIVSPCARYITVLCIPEFLHRGPGPLTSQEWKMYAAAA